MGKWQAADNAQAGKGEHIGLPIRPFLFTIDQIATLIGVSIENVMQTKLYYDRRSVGQRHKDMMLAHDIATPGQPSEWRVAEREFVRWLRYKGFIIRENSWTTH